MRKQLLAAVSFAVLVTFFQPGWADEQSHKKAVEELFVVMKTEEGISDSLDQMLQAQVEANPQNPGAMDAARQFYFKYLGWESQKPDMTEIFMKTFNEEEIRELISFYKTPVGQKLIDKMPEVSAKVMEIAAKRMQEHMPEFYKMMSEITAVQPENPLDKKE
ncbi:MAG: DUF2059 domain-containing protein [Candidatus Aureabacteria bacterium]|nr:DUF2059 domain-containing protein [Candidatus Auribacterota bacterium]